MKPAGTESATSNWGLCLECKWWQLEPDAGIENLTAGFCIEESLQQFQLRVTGNSGCNKFMQVATEHSQLRVNING